MHVFFDLPAFVAMLPLLLGLVIYFAEGVFGIANGFSDDFERFGHSLILLFKFSQVRRMPSAFPW